VVLAGTHLLAKTRGMEEAAEGRNSTPPLQGTAHRLELQVLHADSPSPKASPPLPSAAAAAAQLPAGAASGTNTSSRADDDSILRLAALLTGPNQGAKDPSAAAPAHTAGAAANGQAPPAGNTGLAALQAVGAPGTSSTPAIPTPGTGLGLPAPAFQGLFAAGGPTCTTEGLPPSTTPPAMGPPTPAQHQHQQAATVSQLLEASTAAPGGQPSQPAAEGATASAGGGGAPTKVKWAKKLGPGGEPKSHLK
jgi:hypothetical protein